MLQRYPKRVFRLRTKDAWERRSLHMVLIGCDFHPSWQQVSWLDMETGETGEQKLVHAGGEAKQFYEQLAAPAVVHDPGLRKQYRHRCHQKPKAVAKLAVARKLAVRLYWMLRTNVAYPEIVRIESSSGLALVGAS